MRQNNISIATKYISMRAAFFKTELARFCELLAAAILCITGLLKFISAFKGAPVNNVLNPVLGVNEGTILWVVALVELYTARMLVFGKDPLYRCIIFTLVILSFFVYRVSLYISMYAGPCKCLGTALDDWPWLKEGTPRNKVECCAGS